MVVNPKAPYGLIFLGKDEQTYGKDGIGFVPYDPDYECGGPEGTPGRKCPYTLPPSGEEDDTNNKMIHVAIASYRDPLCPRTLYNLFTKASNPDRIHVRVLQQNDPEVDTDCLEGYCELLKKDGVSRCSHRDRVEIHQVHAKDAKGPTFARGLLSQDIHTAYEEGVVGTQDFCLGMDSHMDFTVNWDTSMREMWNMAKNEYAVLSTYVDSTEHLGENKIQVPHLCMVRFTSNVRTHATKSINNLIKPKLTNAIYGAGLVFSKCHAELKVPVDPHTPYIFDGEEFNRAARLWTSGYDIYTPHKVFILHNYLESQSNPVTTGWNRKSNHTAYLESNKRLLTMIDVPGGYTDSKLVQRLKRSMYGLGDRRTLDQLIQFSGIDLRQKKVTIDGKNRCGNVRWVDFNEHPMGVDYIPKFDRHENPLDVPDQTSVWYDKASTIEKGENNNPIEEPINDASTDDQSKINIATKPPLRLEMLRGLQNRHLLPESRIEHGIQYLPLPVKLSVVFLLMGVIVTISLTRGTGIRGVKKAGQKKHTV